MVILDVQNHETVATLFFLDLECQPKLVVQPEGVGVSQSSDQERTLSPAPILRSSQGIGTMQRPQFTVSDVRLASANE